MIRRLSGIITYTELSYVVLDVGGVGYLVYTPEPSTYQLNTPVVFHTHLAVRENALDIYGFPDKETLKIFELLIGLPKIGPKSALQILTQADSSLLKEAVANNDPAHLSKLSGIGKKSAEKIVLGLKDAFEDLAYSPHRAHDRTTSTPTNTSDTIDALISLGYPIQEARRVVLDITAEHPNLVSSAETIKLALKRLHS